jgi:hypothetical protein
MKKGETMRTIFLTVFCLALGVAVGRGEDLYYVAALEQLELKEFARSSHRLEGWDNQRLRGVRRPYAVLEGEGEAYVQGRTLAVRVPQEHGPEIRGRVFLPEQEGVGFSGSTFSLLPAQVGPVESQRFNEIRAAYYQSLLEGPDSSAGSAWFRHRVRQVRQTPGGGDIPGTIPPARRTDLEDTYELFTGGRALSENLQLDRPLLIFPAGQEEMVEVDSLAGITIAEIDWAPLVAGLQPALDPLAPCIPADQHALFFHSFQAMIDLMDEADAQGTPVLHMLEPRSEDARTSQRYQEQLCLAVSEVARQFGPQVVSSVAFTGSDPYLRMGTDLAILFSCKSPLALKTYLLAKHALALQAGGVERAEGELGKGTVYSGVCSSDRKICSYVASWGDVVVVANSLHQLRRIAETHAGQIPALAASDEYRFFRNRYKLGEAGETAFLILTDAAIRRWCSPRWRIADSRRTRAAALLAELQAERVDVLWKLQRPSHPPAPLDLAGLGTIQPGPSGMGGVSSVYGTLDFMTPISELQIDKVSRAEAEAYGRFRDRYQLQWRRFFDPIAVRFGVRPERVGIDLTVMPLIEGSEYREFVNLARGAKIQPGAGDPHEGVLFHAALSINTQSGMLQQGGGMAMAMTAAAGVALNPLVWLGESVSVYLDEHPYWNELMAASETSKGAWEFMEKSYGRLPLAVNFEVKNTLALTVFLTGLRAYIDQTAPGMTVWETLTRNERPYVKISPSEAMVADEEQLKGSAIYYAVTPGLLTVSLNEQMLHRALDRAAARKGAKEEGATQAPSTSCPWSGENLCLKVGAQGMALLKQVRNLPEVNRQYRGLMQLRSWSNIPILNEWRRLIRDEKDPVKFHRRFWRTDLVCAGGGTYVWNETWQTMESTVCGCPAEPKDGIVWPPAIEALSEAEFGLTFEDQGLRGRVRLER